LNIILAGVAASAIAGLATGLGALPMLLVRRLSARAEDALLGFAAGVMLAASFFSLIQPGIVEARADGAGAAGAAAIVLTAVLVGALAIHVLNRKVPHEHLMTGRHRPDHPRLRRVWLFVIAITLHNFPEGLAVGVGFGGGDFANGMSLALAIGLQNLPEGLAVAAALMSLSYPRSTAVLIATCTGLVEVIGGAVGVGAVVLAAPFLPVALGFAGGAMLFVVSNEIIPDTHSRGNETAASAGLMIGLTVMTFLDTTLS
jgi:zinc transporter, ZIP family